MVAVVVVQTIFEILITIWNMVYAYYVQRQTWDAIANSVYIAAPCLIKCVIYVIVFRQVPKEPVASQAMTMRSLSSRSENPYGDPNESLYGLATRGAGGSTLENPYGSRSMTYGSRGGLSTGGGGGGENPYASR